MPTRGNIEFIEMLDRFDLEIDRFDTADPTRLEIPYYFLNDLKNRTNITPKPEDNCILEPIVDRFPPLVGVDKSIRHSWHYEFLRDIEEKGIDFNPIETEYFDYYEAQEKLLGTNRHHRCIAKCERLSWLYRKIQNEGFSYPYLYRFLVVTETPLSVTRHGMTAFNSYYEIFSGHHRAAIAAFMGIKQVKVVVVRDNMHSHSNTSRQR
jgi:hypothetical protein